MNEWEKWVQLFDMQEHPEGGFYKEIYRSPMLSPFPEFEQPRNLATGIYFLLLPGQFSALHRIKSDEGWHWYAGHTLEVVEISPSGQSTITELGPEANPEPKFQYYVAAGHWFGSRVKQGGDYALVGCTVSPGFDFRDFEMATRDSLSAKFSAHHSLISQFTHC